jgi:hypothetical protein
MGVNHSKMRIFGWVKRRLVRAGIQPRRVPIGLFSGLRLNLNLQDQLQTYLGLWERETYRFVRRACRSSHWVADVGAGRGELSLFFLNRGSAERVLAIEPDHDEVAGLRANVALNHQVQPDALRIVEACIGTTHAPGFVRLDDLGLPIDTPGFIKVDVDGGELDVLKSGERLLSEGIVELLVETHSRQLELECLAYLGALGYQCQIVKNAWWRIVVPELRPIAHNRWLWATRR